MKSHIQKCTSPTVLSLLVGTAIILGTLFVTSHYTLAERDGDIAEPSGPTCVLLTAPCGFQGNDTCVVEPQQWVEYYPCGPQGDSTCTRACGPSLAPPIAGVCGTPLEACESPYLNCVATGNTTNCNWVYPACAQPTATTGRYSCTTGTSINNVENNSTWQYTWICQGANGGASASCSENKANQTPFVFAGVDIVLKQPATSVTVGDAQGFDR